MKKTDNADWLKNTPKSWNNSIFVLLKNGESYFISKGWTSQDKKHIHFHEISGEINITYIEQTIDIKIADIVLIIIQDQSTKRTSLFVKT